MGRLTGLDALRGIAALVVAASHFNRLVLGGPYIEAASLSVDFFFMLSGFIMARTYDAKMPANFIFLRAKRLWPAFAFGTILGAILGLGPWHLLPFALLFLPTPLGAFPFNPPAWSLFCELLANALHAAIFQRTRNVILVLMFSLPAWSILMMDGGAPFNSWANLPEALLRVAVAYSIGVLLWRHNVKLPLPGWLAVFGFGLAFLPNPAFEPLVVLVVFPLMIWIGQRWDAGFAGLWAGRASYPLYAAHYPVLAAGLSWLYTLIAGAVATAVAGWIDGRRYAAPRAEGH